MTDEMVRARERIADQKGRLAGWRPMQVGADVAVVALEVLGTVRDQPGQVGMRVAVAGRSPEAIDRDGDRAAEASLRKRAVLGPEDAFRVEGRGRLHAGEGAGDDLLAWPWRSLTFHVPLERLPAIAGLTTDTVPRA